MTNSNTVVVLPAFETAPQKNMTLAHQLADTAALMNKGQLGRLVQKKLIYQFALYLFRQVGGVMGAAMQLLGSYCVLQPGVQPGVQGIGAMQGSC